MHKVFILVCLFYSNIFLAQDSFSLKTMKVVEIFGKRSNPEKLPNADQYTVLSGKKNDVLKLDNIDMNLVTNNTRQLFSRVAGVNIWENDGSGVQVGISVRGLNPNRSWELNNRQNGYDISSDIFGYPEAYYSPPMEAVDKIEFIRGGASLQYGSQFGGMINYILKRENRGKPFYLNTTQTMGSYGLMNSYLSIGGQVKKLNYFAYNQMRKAEGWRENSFYSMRNSHFFLKYTIDSQSSISAEYTNTSNNLQQAGGLTDLQFYQNDRQSNRPRNWMSLPWNLFSVNYESKIANNLNFNLKLFGLIGARESIGFIANTPVKDSFNFSSNSYLYNRQIDRDEYQNLGLEFRSLYIYKMLNLPIKMAFGGRYYQANTHRLLRGTGDLGVEFNQNLNAQNFPTDLKFKTNNIALFVENQIQLTEKLTINPGIRYEYIESSISGKLNTANNLEIMASQNQVVRNLILTGFSFQYDLSHSNFYGNFSQAYRPVLFSDITPPSTSDVIDPNLRDANGYTIDIGYRGYSKNKIFNFDLSLFYLAYNNRIGTVRKYFDDNPVNMTYQYRTNLGNSLHRGMELFINCDVTKLIKLSKKNGQINVFTSQSVIDARYLDFKLYSIAGSAPNVKIVETNLTNNQVEYAPNLISNFGISYQLKQFSMTMQSRYTSGVYTDASNIEVANSNGTNGKLDAYTVFDFSGEYQLKKYVKFQAGIQNLFDQKYASRRAGGYPGPGIIPGEGRTYYFGLNLKL